MGLKLVRVIGDFRKQTCS